MLKLMLVTAAAIGLVAGTTAAAAAVLTSPISISSLSTLPPVTKPLNPRLKTAIAREAANIHVDPQSALHRLRLLRSNVTGLPLYAFAGPDNKVCFLVWGGAGSCGQITSVTEALFVWGGGSRKRGQVVVGIVADAVVAVKVRINNTSHLVKPLHNAFVVPYRDPSARVTVVALTH